MTRRDAAEICDRVHGGTEYPPAQRVDHEPLAARQRPHLALDQPLRLRWCRPPAAGPARRRRRCSQQHLQLRLGRGGARQPQPTHERGDASRCGRRTAQFRRDRRRIRPIKASRAHPGARRQLRRVQRCAGAPPKRQPTPPAPPPTRHPADVAGAASRASQPIRPSQRLKAEFCLAHSPIIPSEPFGFLNTRSALGAAEAEGFSATFREALWAVWVRDGPCRGCCQSWCRVEVLCLRSAGALSPSVRCRLVRCRRAQRGSATGLRRRWCRGRRLSWHPGPWVVSARLAGCWRALCGRASRGCPDTNPAPCL